MRCLQNAARGQGAAHAPAPLPHEAAVAKDNCSHCVIALQPPDVFVQASRRAPQTHLLGQPLEAPSRAGSTCLGGMAQNEVAQSSAATVNAGHKTIATSGAVGYAVTLRLYWEIVGVWGVWAIGAHAVGPDA